LRFPSTEIKLVFEALVSPEMAVTLPAATDCREVLVDDSSSRDSVVTDEDTNRQDLHCCVQLFRLVFYFMGTVPIRHNIDVVLFKFNSCNYIITLYQNSDSVNLCMY